MKLGYFTERRSLAGGIRCTLGGLIIMVSFIFSFLTYIQRDVFNEYSEYMDINSKLGTISDELNSSWKDFSGYMNGKTVQLNRHYQETNRQLDQTILTIKPYMQENTDTSIYFRTLSNMIDDYEKRSGPLMRESTFDSNGYNELKSLSTLMIYIENQESQLTVSYLNYSSDTYSRLLKGYENIALKTYIITMLIMIVGSVYAAKVGANLISVIKKLCRYAEKLSNAHWEIPDIEDQKFEEIDKLAGTFNKMKIKIRDSIARLNLQAELERQFSKEQIKNVENEKLLKEIQLTVLQSQMNPHFLFNTLNLISRTAMFENAGDTIKLVEATSKILRYSLNCQNSLVNLSRELEMVRCYIMIQKTRFQEQMNFNFRIGNGIGDVRIPPMTIQPLIENAIIHGLNDRDSGGMIDISIEMKNGFCEVSIQDNGIGMPQDKIDQILNYGNRCSLGIYNIKKRLELNFEESNLLRIESKVGKGTLVTISIPVGNTHRDENMICLQQTS